MPAAIKPDAIPGKDLNPDEIELQAGTISTIGTSVADNGFQVHQRWQGMAAVYEAPESGTLLGLMQPVSTDASATGDNLAVVASALTAFAEEVRPIKERLDALRLEAQEFVDTTVANGVDVQQLNPAWVSAQSYGYGVGGGVPSTYGYATTGSSATAAEPEKYQTVHREWHEDQDAVDRNNDLIAQVNAQQVLLWEAERTCANKIRALYCAAPLHAGYESENDPLGYGVDEIPEGTDMPWGAEVERTEGCGEAAVNFVVKDFLWEGIVVNGLWGTVQGLGALTLGYNPNTGDWFSGEAYGAAWGGLGMLAASAVVASTPPLNLLFMADDAVQQFGGDSFLPDPIADFDDKMDESMLNMGKSLIAWDQWQDDPGTAAGTALFNVGTIFIPVAGEVAAGLKGASTAATVVSRVATVVDLVDPASLAFRGVSGVGRLGLGSIDNFLGRLDELSRFESPRFDAPHVETHTAADAASALDRIDELGVRLDEVTTQVNADGSGTFSFPGGQVDVPRGGFEVPGGAAEVPVVVREPELVAAGGGRADAGGPGVVNAIVDDAPVRTDTAGSGESTVVREPETETTGGGSGGTGGDDAGSPGANQGDPGSGGAGADRDGSGVIDDRDDAPGTGSFETSPDRVYSMMDGVEHAATFAPEQLGPSRVVDSLLQSNGVTRAEFTDLINRPISTLSSAERGIVNSVRDALTAQITPDTVFQKVMDQPHFDVQPDGSVKLVFGQAENMILNDSSSISGSVSVAEDTAHLATPRDFFERLRLDYPNTNFSAGDDSAFVVRFQVDQFATVNPADAMQPQLHSSMGGNGSVDHYSPPFTGNGFLKAPDDILPEYRANKVEMREGAEVWEVLDDGTQRLYAVLRGDEWIPQGN